MSQAWMLMYRKVARSITMNKHIVASPLYAAWEYSPATRALVIVRAVDAASGLNVTETYEVSFDDADGFVDDAREGTEAEGTEASALAQ